MRIGLLLWGLVLVGTALVHLLSCAGVIGPAHTGSPLVFYACGGFGCVFMYFGLGGKA